MERPALRSVGGGDLRVHQRLQLAQPEAGERLAVDQEAGRLADAQGPGRGRERALLGGDQESPCAIPIKLYRSPIHTNMHT